MVSFHNVCNRKILQKILFRNTSIQEKRRVRPLFITHYSYKIAFYNIDNMMLKNLKTILGTIEFNGRMESKELIVNKIINQKHSIYIERHILFLKKLKYHRL